MGSCGSTSNTPPDIPNIVVFKDVNAAIIDPSNVNVMTTKEEKFVIDDDNINEWEEFGQIGSGGLSTCFSYINRNNAKVIVVKKSINDEIATKEFSILKEIDHINIVDV